LYASSDSGNYQGRRYIKLLFCNADFTGPTGRNRPEETLVVDRMKYDSNTHFVQGSDAVIAEPLTMSLTFRAFDRKNGAELMKWITDHQTRSGKTLPSLKGYSGLYDYAGTYWKTNAFTDTSKVCFDVEMKYDEDTSDAGGVPLTVKMHEVLFNQGDQTFTDGEDAVNVSLSGMVYGSVDFGSLDFTSGSLIDHAN
jgi:hypothetical protein